MYPELFKIGKLTVYTYGLMIALGLMLAVALFYYLSKKFKISEKTFNFYTTTVLVSIIVGFLFAVLYQAVYNWIDSGFKSFSLFHSGMTFMGGLIGGVGMFLIITAIFAKGQVRTDFWKVANIIATCIPLAHGFGRIGCFFGGCCYGMRSDSPIAMQFPGMGYKVLPTQLFEAAFLFVLFGVMLFLLLKYERIDLMMLIYLFSYAVWRFIIEYFRGDDRGSFIPGLTPSQFQSILMVLVAGALTLYIYYFNRIPFAGKQKIGRSFKEFALASEGGDASVGESALFLKNADAEVASERTSDEISETALSSLQSGEDSSESEHDAPADKEQ